MPMYRFTLDVIVNDAPALRAAARVRAIEDGSPMDPGFAPLGDCLHMLLDPGSLDGCNVLGGDVERTGD